MESAINWQKEKQERQNANVNEKAKEDEIKQEEINKKKALFEQRRNEYIQVFANPAFKQCSAKYTLQ